MSVSIGKLLNQSWMKSSIKRIMRLVGDCCNELRGDGKCWPSIQTLADHGSLSRSTIIRNIKECVRLELLIVHKRKHKNGRATSNVYEINLIRLSELAKEKFYSDEPPTKTYDEDVVNLPSFEDLLGDIQEADPLFEDLQLVENPCTTDKTPVDKESDVVSFCYPSKENKNSNILNPNRLVQPNFVDKFPPGGTRLQILNKKWEDKEERKYRDRRIPEERDPKSISYHLKNLRFALNPGGPRER